MNKKTMLFTAMLSIAALVFAGGTKEIDTSWYQDYPEEEQKLIEKYEFESSDLTNEMDLNGFLDELADIKLYGNREFKNLSMDRAGYLRAAYDDPLHILDIYDAYLKSLRYDEISQKYNISKSTYNTWVLSYLWDNSIVQANELKEAATSRLYSDFALTDIYSTNQLTAVYPYSGFSEKLIQNGTGMVGTSMVMDVLAFGNHVLEETKTPVFTEIEFYEMLLERYNDDVEAIKSLELDIDEKNRAIIEDLGKSIARYSEIMYRLNWFDKTYVSFYYLPDTEVNKFNSLRDWDFGMGGAIGFGFTGATLSSYMRNTDLTAYIGNENFERNFAFGLSTQYNFELNGKHYIGLGLSSRFALAFVESQIRHDNGYSTYYTTTEDMEVHMKVGIPLSYKYLLQDSPILFNFTFEPGIEVTPDKTEFNAAITFGMQYLMF